MFKLNKFLIQKKYNEEKKELIINDYKEGMRIDSKYKIIYNFINNKRDGEYLMWYENGRLWIKNYYKNNKRYDEYLMWHENGQLWIKEYYKNGKYQKCYYKNGKSNDKWLQWYENGQLKEKSYYKNGIKL